MDTEEQEDALLALEHTARMLKGPLVPLLPPKAAGRSLPPLALRLSSEAPFGSRHGGWTVETFIVPAAFPRSFAGSTQRPTAEPEQTGGRVDAAAAYKDLLEAQVAANKRGQIRIDDQDELEEQQQLHLAVNRYRPRTQREGGPRGLTLVFAHASGFCKEIWEPVIADLFAELADPSRPSSLPIDEIWALDAPNQGDSGVLNEAVLGPVFNWADYGRDILSIIISHLDEPTAARSRPDLPTLAVDPSLLALDTRPQPAPAASPTARTWRERIIVGIGHSFGGAAMVYAASALPSLFSSLILLDPGLPLPSVQQSVGPFVMMAFSRREVWSSREEARAAFNKNPFFQRWDPRVLDVYCQYALKELKEGRVALKTRAKDEAVTFGDPCVVTGQRACERFASIPDVLPMHLVLADHQLSVMEATAVRLHEIAPHVTSSRIPGAGHLVAQDDPTGTAKEIAEALRRTYPIQQASKM